MSKTNINTNNITNQSTSLSPQYKCHKCAISITLHPSQIESINKQQKSNKNKNIADNIVNSNNNNNNSNNNDISSGFHARQCVYVSCPIRSNNLFECSSCSLISLCRNCGMILCKLCRINLKVLSCNYCSSFICSQQCYAELIRKYFKYLASYGILTNAHESMHFFRKLLYSPHLHAALSNINSSHIPFHVCEICKVHTCGCVDWMSCVHCRKYYCVDCESKALQKCALDECQSRTCCHKYQWDNKCEYCNKLNKCRLVFCTKGHCNRHIIVNREIDFNQKDNNSINTNINDDNKDNNDNNDKNDNNNIDIDTDLTSPN